MLLGKLIDTDSMQKRTEFGLVRFCIFDIAEVSHAMMPLTGQTASSFDRAKDEYLYIL